MIRTFWIRGEEALFEVTIKPTEMRANTNTRLLEEGGAISEFIQTAINKRNGKRWLDEPEKP